MKNYSSIKVHDDTYLMLQDMASKAGRTIVKTFDMIVLAEYLRVQRGSGNSLPETLAQQFETEALACLKNISTK